MSVSATTRLLDKAPSVASNSGAFDGSVAISNGAYEAATASATYSLNANSTRVANPSALQLDVKVPSTNAVLGGAVSATGLRVSPLGNGAMLTAVNLDAPLDVTRIGTFIGSGGAAQRVPCPSMTAQSVVYFSLSGITAAAAAGLAASGIDSPDFVYTPANVGAGTPNGFTHNADAGMSYNYMVIG